MKVRYKLRNRAARKARHDERQAARELRTPEQQLALLNAKGYQATRERDRLNALILARKKAA